MLVTHDGNCGDKLSTNGADGNASSHNDSYDPVGLHLETPSETETVQGNRKFH